MGGKKPTLADLAKTAGVSLATVDRVVNGRGGVAPDKEVRIVDAARLLRLDRALTHRPQRTLRVAVLIQPPKNPYHAALKAGLDHALPLFSDLNMQFLVHHIDPNDSARLVALIGAQAQVADGLIVTAPDEPSVADALRAAASHKPLVTLATDVVHSGRAAYIGPDDRQAGRVAGDLFGRFLGREGGKIAMVVGLRESGGHREREAGFREIIAERYPRLSLGPILESGEDAQRAGRLVFDAFGVDSQLKGLYHCSAGAAPAVEALTKLGRSEDTVFITHELTQDRRSLLVQRRIDAVIDQNPELEMRISMEVMARLLRRLSGKPESVIVDVRIHMAENA